MTERFKDWFLHNHQANQEYITIFEQGEDLPVKGLEIFSHLLMAHKIWLSRIQSLSEAIRDPWYALEKSEFAPLDRANLEGTLSLLEEHTNTRELEMRITYENSKKEKYENSIAEILYHILTHSAYHRGQVALLLRQKETVPPVTDYIFLKRTKIRS